MQIGVHTDNNITGNDALTSRVTTEVEAGLGRYARRVTRVEVHLADESAGRPTGNDIRCGIEVVLEGQSPAIATHHAGTLDAALAGAVHKLDRVLESQIGRLSNQTARTHG